ncbi:MAG: TonB-dependent receptor, partial [Alteromonadaceae bacterium]
RIHSQWNDWFASVVGLRYDYFDMDVEDKLNALNSGSENDDLVTPKLSLRFGPFKDTEFFINLGKGLHSNDARGVVADEVPLLSESTGYELGIRSTSVENLQLSLVLFQLNLDSELVFVGDDGTTEPKDASRRRGIEFSVYYQATDWFVLDADYTKSQARFKDDQFDGDQLLGNRVPDSIEDVFSMGLSFDLENGLYTGLRLRYFGPRNLTENTTVQSKSSSMVNANIGYRFNTGLAFSLEILNLTDRKGDDITYWYASRTQEERENNIEAIEDFHSHAMIPRTLRGTISYEF